MSLADFQRALSEMTLNPLLAAAVRRLGSPALEAYQLTPLETGRLISVSSQPGMSLTCTLARANRFATIVGAYPLTCSLLKPQLKELLNELWSSHRPDNYQLAGEDDAFAGFLQYKLARGEIQGPYAEEIFRYEAAAWALMQTLRKAHLSHNAANPPDTFVAFEHDPRVLIPSLQEDRMPPSDLPSSAYIVRLRLKGDTLEVDLESGSII